MPKREREKEIENTPTVVDWTYVWVAGDGSIRSAVFTCDGTEPKLQRFDGSATKQAATDNSDLYLLPVKVYKDTSGWVMPTRHTGIVLCEVRTADGTPHSSNSRATLRNLIEENTSLGSVKIGFEQEFLLIDPDTRQPYMWPTSKNDKGEVQIVFPGPQGRYYAGSGDFVRGRQILDSFANKCVWSNVPTRSYVPSICLSQWAYTLGETDLLTSCDNLIMSRYLLETTAELEVNPRCVVSYVPKSFPGTEWHGNGCNFRLYLENYTKSGGNAALAKMICETIGKDHRNHMAAYGFGNEQRLVGKTGGISDYNRFTWGYGDRTASLCVPTLPIHADSADFVYIEDRRPGGNVDPYNAVMALSRTLLDVVDLEASAEPSKAETSESNLVT